MPWFENKACGRIWYEDHGHGDVILLLHGWCMSSLVWRKQIEFLKTSFRVVAPDLRGHGRSNGEFASYELADFATDLAALFGHLEISGALLAGWSMGGEIALQALSQIDGRLAGLALISSTPCFTANSSFPYGLSRAETDGMALKVRRNLSRALEGFRGLMFADGELADPWLADEVACILSEVAVPDVNTALKSLQALAAADMRPLLASVNLPTLLASGDKDRICLPAATEYLCSHLCNSHRVCFAGCGHAPFLTQPERFAAILTEFFRGIRDQR